MKTESRKRKANLSIIIIFTIGQNMLDKNEKPKAIMDSTETDREVYLENNCS